MEKEKEAKRSAQDDDYWKECQDNEQWEKYIEKYPNGRHIDEAREALRAEKQLQADREDDNYWETICKPNKKWTQYLKKYPEGRHTPEARELLDKQKEENALPNRLGKKLKTFVDNLLSEE